MNTALTHVLALALLAAPSQAQTAPFARADAAHSIRRETPVTTGTVQPDTVRHPAPDVIRTFQVHIPTKDQMLDDITLYWLTNSATSSAQLYRENNNNNNNFNAVGAEDRRHQAPELRAAFRPLH